MSDVLPTPHHSVPRRHARGPLARAARGLAGVLLAVAVAELLLRVAVGGAHLAPPVFRNAQADARRYVLEPGSQAAVRQFGRTISLSVAADGTRRTPAAPARASRIVHLVGDSQVFGWGLSDDETIASRLQARLGDTVAVVNHGVPGYGAEGYLAALASIPASDRVIVLHAEENDGADAYGLARNGGAACGFLVSLSLDAGPLTCAGMRLRLVELGFVAWSAFQHRHAMTPLGFSAHSQVAAAVLYPRIADSYAQERARRGDRLSFSVVPWKGRYAQSSDDYLPPPLPQAETLPSPLPDDLAMPHRFALRADRLALFLDGDTHLSPAGADFLAGVLHEAYFRPDVAAAVTP